MFLQLSQVRRNAQPTRKHTSAGVPTADWVGISLDLLIHEKVEQDVTSSEAWHVNSCGSVEVFHNLHHVSHLFTPCQASTYTAWSWQVQGHRAEGFANGRGACFRNWSAAERSRQPPGFFDLRWVRRGPSRIPFGLLRSRRCSSLVTPWMSHLVAQPGRCALTALKGFKCFSSFSLLLRQVIWRYTEYRGSMSNISPYAMWVQVIWFLFDLDEQGSFANLCYPKRAVHSASFHTLVAAQACVGGESW